MSKYWLMQNLMYNHKYIVKVNKLKRLLKYLGFGYSLHLASIYAFNRDEAIKQFKDAGFTL